MCTKVYAADPQIIIEGDSTAKAGETKKITVKVSSDTYTVGAISGKIETDAKIEKIQVGQDGEGDTAGLNGWSITYNPDTSLFVASKASGTNDSGIMEFSYTLKSGETGSSDIKLSQLELSCLLDGEYTTRTLSNVSKNITIEVNTTTDKEDETQDKDEEEEKQDKDNEKGETQDKNNKPEKDENQDKNDKTTTDKNKLPHTGVSGYILLSIGGVGLISFVIYKVYKKNYKKI